jgi:hypothetical protein
VKIELFKNDTDEVERPEGVRTQWVSVTPEYAMRILDEYEKFCDAHPAERMNRPVHQSQVDKYVADMVAGRWGRNHQGLAFDKNGTLMDGQHRLWAVANSGVTVMMPVTYGLDREAQLTIDSGLRRTTADVAAIAGFDGVRELHISVVRAMIRGTSPTRPTFTRMQELELLKTHWKAVSFVLDLVPKQKIQGITRAPVLAVLARAFYTIDPDRLARFAEVLITGIPETTEEHVIIKLRNWLVSDRTTGNASSLDAHGKTTRALQAYLKGEHINTLYAAKEDVFIIPGGKRGK